MSVCKALSPRRLSDAIMRWVEWKSPKSRYEVTQVLDYAWRKRVPKAKLALAIHDPELAAILSGAAGKGNGQEAWDARLLQKDFLDLVASHGYMVHWDAGIRVIHFTAAG